MGRSAVVVLGMHRSGTSSVAGALTMLGATPPRTLMAPAEDNPRGFWESVVLADFNDRLLAARGSAWNDAGAFDIGAVPALDAFTEEASTLLRAEFGGQSPIVLKDPRICRIFPFWAAVLANAGYGVAVISPLRDPVEVAASLSSRNGFSQADGLRLWLRHVLDAEAASRDRPRIFLPWPEFLADWRTAMGQARRRLGLPLIVPAPGEPHPVDAFLSRDLRRQAAPAPAGNPLVVRAWQALTHIAHHGEEPAVHAELDAVRGALDQETAAFARD